MSRVSSAVVAAALVPDPQSREPLYRQLYEKLRGQILSGVFSAGQQIPSSRVLAADLCVSRTTVMNAIEQLIAEGYLEGAAGTGTFVTGAVPADMTSIDRALYEERADALVQSTEEYLKGVIDVTKPVAGMHTIGWLADGISDRDTSRLAKAAGLCAWPLSSCYRDGVSAAPRQGLILGFAAYSEPQIADAVRTLAGVLSHTACAL